MQKNSHLHTWKCRIIDVAVIYPFYFSVSLCKGHGERTSLAVLSFTVYIINRLNLKKVHVSLLAESVRPWPCLKHNNQNLKLDLPDFPKSICLSLYPFIPLGIIFVNSLPSCNYPFLVFCSRIYDWMLAPAWNWIHKHLWPSSLY